MAGTFLIFSAYSLAVASIQQNTISVSDYGAYPNDGIDDTEAIRLAIADADPSGSKLVFQPGQYDISGQEAGHPAGHYFSIFNINNYSNLSIEGNGAIFSAQQWATIFRITHSQNIRIKDLTIDWDKSLPFTAGEVINREGEIVDVRIEPPHPIRSGLAAQTFHQYNPTEDRLADNGYDIYQLKETRPCEVVESDILRCYLSSENQSANLPVGSHTIVRHQVYGYDSFQFVDVSGAYIDNVKIYSAPGMGVYSMNSEDFKIRNLAVKIKPESGRWLSTTADAVHFANSRGTLDVKDIHFEGMGDDGLNVHTFYLELVERLDSNTVHLRRPADRYNHAAELQFRVGDEILLGIWPNPLTPIAQLTVTSVSESPAKEGLTLSFDQPLPDTALEGALFVNQTAVPEQTRIQDCLIENNRARGLMLQAHHVNVRGCTFRNISGPAVSITSDATTFFEGIPPRNIGIKNNTFIDNNYGAVRRGGMVSIYGTVSGQPSLAGTFQGIDIWRNQFIHQDGEVGIFISSADGINLAGNSFSPNITHPIVADEQNSCAIWIDGISRCRTENPF
ncbi:MAG: right-handed parallel beta-helix repeat-containing protein [Cyanobacteria bacterium P01_A01_bin.17]